MRQYVGTYEREMVAIEVTRDGAALRIQGRPRKPPEGWEEFPTPPPLIAGFTERDRLLVFDGAGKGSRGTFIRNSDGSIGWLRFGQLAQRM